MAEDNQILQTTVDDIDRISQLIVGNSATKLRTAMAMAQRRIMVLQQMLGNLRSHENVVKGRIYNNYEQTYIEQNLAAGKFTPVDAKNSFDVERVSPNPNPTVAAITYRIYNDEGNQKLRTELDKINYDIKMILANINKYENLLETINTKLQEAENQKSKQQTLVEKATGRVYPPTLTDLEVDRIRKSAYSNVSLLYNLSKAYHDLTVDGYGIRKYPDDDSLPPKLLIMRQVFWATVQQFPQYLQDRKDEQGTTIPKLNTQDPGSDQNMATLLSDLNIMRSVGKDTATDQLTDKYVRELKSISTDVSVSRGIERKPDPVLPDSNSMNFQTKTASYTAIRLGNSYMGSWELPSLASAISKLWKKKNKDLYVGLPLCPNVTKPPTTSTDKNEEAATIINDALRTKGAETFQKALTEAAKAYQFASGLPEDAPSWVKSWTKIYDTGPIGSIDNDLIVRTFAGTLDKAKNQAKILVKNPPYSITKNPTQEYSYTVQNKNTGGNISETYIYFADWAN